MAGPVRRRVRRRGNRQHLLRAPRAGAVRPLGRDHRTGLPLRREDEPIPHPRASAARARRSGATRVLADRGGVASGHRTAPWAYLRLHRGGGPVAPAYSTVDPRRWVDRLIADWGPNPHGWVFFDNDTAGAAVDDAREFIDLAKERSITVADRTVESDSEVGVSTVEPWTPGSPTTRSRSSRPDSAMRSRSG
ncbi:MAG: DUF72 domain-containing protein [Actinomycetota bacterium]